MPRSRSLYDVLVRARSDPGDVEALAPEARGRVAPNGLRQIAAQSLQGAGDQVVNAKTVLPWVLTTAGAPAMFLAMLVPVRESGSMLPQVAMTPYLRRMRHRKHAWMLGAAGQGVSSLAMAFVVLTSEGWAAGLGILGSLAVFALARALCSLASKDVLGRTVPSGQRGQINGAVTVVSGIVALTIGLGLQLLGDDLDETAIALLMAGAAVAWVAGAAIYAGVREPAGADPDTGDVPGWVGAAAALLREDPTFRLFVTVRALLLVSALSPPFVVSIGVDEGAAGISGLGLFVLAQGAANVIGGRSFGLWADRSSRLLMIWCAVAASVLIIAFLALTAATSLGATIWLYPAVYLVLALVHVGTRVARKTYVVDIAEGDRRTEYVAVSNAAMGGLLLAGGALTALLATWGPELALVLLAVLGLVGAVLGRRLPETGHALRG